ncbi:MAG: UDP-N-acetylmuramate--L-alanine ligase [Chlamydiota bacterium]
MRGKAMKKNETYHLIGLGGIGMSALARILLQRGYPVQGSDAVFSPLLGQLQKEGAVVFVGHNADVLTPGITVVVSSGIKPDNVEIAKAKELNLPILHRSDLLDLLMCSQKALLVTGTHGKTTTSALLAAVLMEASMDPSFVVGGILRALNTNGQAGAGAYFVAEADESDGSFLKTAPFGAIVTNLENDHLDYWGTEEKLNKAFERFFEISKNLKHLFWCRDDPRLLALGPKGVSYGFSPLSAALISHFEQSDQGIAFDLSFQEIQYRKIELSLLGRHNALNGAAVFGLARSLDVPEEAIRRAFQKFSGTARRLECKGQLSQLTLYDDYGHHPTEIAVTLLALREKYKNARLVAIFQPHRYTRVRDLFDSFPDCFECADEVILTDIYGAGEAPIEGITSAALHAKMKERLGAKVHFIPRAQLIEGVARHLKQRDVAITLGAGDITHTGGPILECFNQLRIS